MARRAITNRRNRRKQDPSLRAHPTDTAIPTIVIATTAITFSFNQPVSLSGIPQFRTVGVNGALPVSATRPTPLTVVCVYALTQAASTSVVIPNRDPAIRTYSGGYALAGSVFP